MNAEFFLRRIELMNCISACDNSEGKEIGSTEQRKKECIKNKEDEQTIKEILQNLQFKEAMQLTEEEINRIRRLNNSHTIIGAAIQTETDNSLGTVLLESVTASERPSAVALLSLIDRYFASKEIAGSNLTAKLQETIMKLLQAAPDNALSYYLNGYRLQNEKKANDALIQIQEGNARKFTNYSKERFYGVVEAVESVGYSQFTARQHAINFASPAELYSQLLKACKALISTGKKEAAKKECLSMGEKIESSSLTTFEKLQGLMIQSLAYRDSTDPNDIELMGKISDKQRGTLENSPKLLKIPFSEIPETVWLQYFEIYVSKDEKAAGSFIEDYYSKTGQGHGK